MINFCLVVTLSSKKRDTAGLASDMQSVEQEAYDGARDFFRRNTWFHKTSSTLHGEKATARTEDYLKVCLALILLTGTTVTWCCMPQQSGNVSIAGKLLGKQYISPLPPKPWLLWSWVLLYGPTDAFWDCKHQAILHYGPPRAVTEQKQKLGSFFGCLKVKSFLWSSAGHLYDV